MVQVGAGLDGAMLLYPVQDHPSLLVMERVDKVHEGDELVRHALVLVEPGPDELHDWLYPT